MKNYKNERNGARGPGFFDMDMRFGYRFQLSQNRRIEVAADVFNLTNHTNFAIPTGESDVGAVPVADGVQHELCSPQAAARRAVRVLTR